MTLRLNFVCTATFLACVSLAACSSSKDAPAPAPAPAPANPLGMSWTVDGSSLTAASTQRTVTATEIELAGTAGSTTASLAYLSLTIPKSVGVHRITGTSNAAALYSITSGTGTVYLATTGTITVTGLTATSATGTFAFTAASVLTPATTKTISAGTFNVAL